MGYRKPLPPLDAPVWKRQPGESLTAYTRFYWYLRQPTDDPHYTARTGRTLSYVADRATVNIKAIEDLAGTYQWTTRAAVYDRHTHAERIHREARVITEHEHALARDEVAAAREILAAVRHNVRTLLEQGGQLAPQELALLADAAATLHVAAQRRYDTSEPAHPHHLPTPTPAPEPTPHTTTAAPADKPVQLSALDIDTNGRGDVGGTGHGAAA